MAILNPIGGSPVNNNGGVVVKGGTLSHSLLTSKSLKGFSLDDYVPGKVHKAVEVAESGFIGTVTALGGGTFNYNNQSNFIIRGKVNNSINGTATSLLRITGSNNGTRRNPAFRESYYRIHITSWNAVTGAATKGGSAGAKVTLSSDDAAHPTDAIPGELVYKTGKKLPNQVDYAPRTGS